MPIGAIDAVSAGAVQGVRQSGYIDGAAAAPAATGATGFATALSGAVENMQQLQSTSNELALRAVTGDLTDIHAATIASTKAQVTVELVAAIRNKGVDAFNEIMRMQA
ncbi:MAG: flagellar hook-basal body complex protein FliE [Microterricola sp.]